MSGASMPNWHWDVAEMWADYKARLDLTTTAGPRGTERSTGKAATGEGAQRPDSWRVASGRGSRARGGKQRGGAEEEGAPKRRERVKTKRQTPRKRRREGDKPKGRSRRGKTTAAKETAKDAIGEEERRRDGAQDTRRNALRPAGRIAARAHARHKYINVRSCFPGDT